MSLGAIISPLLDQGTHRQHQPGHLLQLQLCLLLWVSHLAPPTHPCYNLRLREGDGTLSASDAIPTFLFLNEETEVWRGNLASACDFSSLCLVSSSVEWARTCGRDYLDNGYDMLIEGLARLR